MATKMTFNKGDLVEALFDYSQNEKGELSMTKGETLRVLKPGEKGDTTWLLAQQLEGKKEKGWVPANFLTLENSIDTHDWCHGSISRNASEYLLNLDKTKGAFLVRESQTVPGSYTLSLFDGRRIGHYRIVEDGGEFHIRPGETFPDIPSLVDRYRDDGGGLTTALIFPVPKAHSKAVVISKSVDKQWELKREDIQLGRVLGEGNYGEVYVANLASTGSKVAVKTIKEDSMEAHEFMQEAHVMKKLQHPNLVKLIGVCSLDIPMYIVTEYVNHGDLLSYLYRHKDLDHKAQLYIATQIAEGMAYLESQNAIHRDLAARNCLVADALVIKIADFGMGRVIEELYTARTGTKMPVKWSAPEALCYNAFSIKSDVWSYGITLWEVSTFGGNPYPDLEAHQVLAELEKGYRMPEPPNCLPGLYPVMFSCWRMNSADRPTFSEIKQTLDDLKPRDSNPEVAAEEEAEEAAAEAVAQAAASAVAVAEDEPPPRPEKPKFVEEEEEAPPRPPKSIAQTPSSGKLAASAEPDWRSTYKRSAPIDPEEIDRIIDLTKSTFSAANKIVRFGEEGDGLVEQVADLMKISQEMVDDASIVGVRSPQVKQAVKAVEVTRIALKKVKPRLDKVQAIAMSVRDATRSLNKALKSVITVQNVKS
eukprot:m.213238 g.213238  ORF g.213238 m.213238 type:complete len:648 (+) comp18602_c0_seq5:1936-3879(+)